MKKPMMTIGAVETLECPMCHKKFLPEDGVYEISNRNEIYCSKHCLNEANLIQEQEGVFERMYEESRYDN